MSAILAVFSGPIFISRSVLKKIERTGVFGLQATKLAKLRLATHFTCYCTDLNSIHIFLKEYYKK